MERYILRELYVHRSNGSTLYVEYQLGSRVTAPSWKMRELPYPGAVAIPAVLAEALSDNTF